MLDPRRTRALIAFFSALLAVGCAVMALAHAGVDIPLVSRLGPGGDRVVAPAVGAFVVGAVLFAVIAAGSARGKAWAWAVGTVVHALTVMGSVMQYRGVASLIAIGVSAVAVALLVSRPGRAAFLSIPLGTTPAG